jgi:hypothetical protein
MVPVENRSSNNRSGRKRHKQAAAVAAVALVFFISFHHTSYLGLFVPPKAVSHFLALLEVFRGHPQCHLAWLQKLSSGLTGDDEWGKK